MSPQIFNKPLFSNAPRSTAFSKGNLKTMTYAKFGRKTERIMGDSKIVSAQKNRATSANRGHRSQSNLPSTLLGFLIQTATKFRNYLGCSNSVVWEPKITYQLQVEYSSNRTELINGKIYLQSST